ncbi:MAG TPA: hypothetical protein VGO03_16575 [Acidimicrobiia bacterium]|jgi:hypothetical protein
MTLDDLEFELRKLPGVRAAGFDDRGDVLMVQLHLAPNGGRGEESGLPLPVAATRIAARHSDKPVAVEVVRWRQAPAAPAENGSSSAATVTAIGAAPASSDVAALPESTGAAETGPRPRLLAVLSFPDTDEVEVHLVLNARRAIGRAPASDGLVAVLRATLDALRGFGLELGVQPMWARHVEDDAGEHDLVAIGVDDPEGGRQLFGLARGSSEIDAAARATLDALNRQIDRAAGS